MRQNTVLTLIKYEKARQNKKWGVQHHSHLVWLPILVEEIGEVGKAICEYYLQSKPGVSLEDIQKGLIQCAAVCVAWLEERF
jgi:NTP pyrophosphatase (non-canonical NTP hydrolase)